MKFLLFLERTLPLVFWMLLIFGFDEPYVAVLTIVSALLHELGHVLVLALFKNKTSGVPIPDISGFRIGVSGLSYKEELLSALAGPLVNLFFGLVPLLLFKSEYVHTFAWLNVMTAISNLLPIKGYDGYRSVLCILSMFTNDRARGEAILSSLSFLFSSIMCFLSLYLMLRIGEGYWIFVVFFSLIISEMAKRQKHTIYEKK